MLVGAVLTLTLTGCGGSESGGDAGQAAESAAHPGEQTYNRYCFSCHAAGVAGAPRVGDAESWAPRIAKGPAALLQSTISGIAPGMPARGLCTPCSDDQLAEAIDFMIRRSQ
jgi:cytochrome c5